MWLQTSLLALVIALTACCSSPEGCTAADDRCVDPTTYAQCRDGALVHLPCRGAGGCAADRAAHCDQSRAEVGDACGSGHACSMDGLSFLECRDGAFVLFSACETCSVRDRAQCAGPTFPPGSVGAGP